MKKEDLQKRLNDVVSQIKANSKDAHFAETLIDKALSLKGQMSVEPVELNVGKRIEEFKGNTFEIVRTDMGIWYHVYGGYNIFVKAGTNNALYETLEEFIKIGNTYDTLDDETKEQFDFHCYYIGYCLNAPLFCFQDVKLTVDMTKLIIDYCESVMQKVSKEPLQDETPKENQEFEDATKALETIKEEAAKEK